MPEQEQGEAEQVLQKLLSQVPDQPWLERDEWYVCVVHLGGEDYVELLAVSGELTDDLGDLVGVAGSLLPDEDEDTDKDDIELVQQAISQGLSENLWAQLDKLIYRYVRSWSLESLKSAVRDDELPPPGEVDDSDRRIQILKKLPIPVLARIIYGLAWHTRNFT